MVDNQQSSFAFALAGGAAAGLTVDLALFPLDTIKTRLQSGRGFFNAGGLKNIYSGLGSVALGSVPGAAIFFCTYETSKKWLSPKFPETQFMAHMLSASIGEIAACVVRVPVEVVKQRAQANQIKSSFGSSFAALRMTLTNEKISGLYRGFSSTVSREVPFSFIQFPIWEFLKKMWSGYQEAKISAWQSAVCGAFAGGFAATVTTPLDVAKTRIMLADKNSVVARGNILKVIKLVYIEKGIRGLFAGVSVRVTWISIGGAIFLGVYEKTTSLSRSYYSA